MFEGREWHPLPGAAPEALEALRAAAPKEMPDSYFSLLSFSNGGEGPLPIHPLNFCLDPAETVLGQLQSGNFGMSELDRVLVFGSNGAGEFFAFDLRQERQCPVVYIDMIAGLASAEFVAPDFDSFLAMVGLEEA